MERDRCAEAASLASNTGDLAGFIVKKAASSILKAAQNGGWEDPTTWMLSSVVVLLTLNEVARAVWGAVPCLQRSGTYPFDR